MKKTLTFQQPSPLPSYTLTIIWLFPFTMVDSSLIGMPEENSRTSPHQVKVKVSLQLVATWGFYFTGRADEQSKNDNYNLMKVLFEYGKRYVVEKLKTIGELALVEELDLDTSEAEIPCPFDPSRIQDPVGAICEVEIDTQDTRSSHHKHPDEGTIFVDLNRIEELQALKSTQFDLAKLIRFCEELNLCYRNECYLAVTMLTRALIDHVSLIFGFNTFAEVVNNYAGTRSFKEQMEHLQNSSRKIADAHLHTRIRSQETLPNRTQVNFANDIDVLLAEIARVLK